ncbi:RNA polymerase sigma factor [Corynebacterium uterequi]|uniref:DNA-directed RNA polymerase specialized sigma subunit, sigma24 n=1 Tax=Corynebacterium uterequi TaxID=1072256 RepID=A0A0G3HFW3_9CORY|nr:sigma-70 family RNA polymerase sigma factor [Corynebacterium uterequi]AKK12184.1 DNA-directed RNA polymerase specialized sigma subunit, sigma24 [Corynebacterium uterequi]
MGSPYSGRPNRPTRPASSGQEATDAELVATYLEGNARAFSTIVTRHRSRLKSIAWRYANSRYDVEDIVQESWLKAATNLSRYRAEAALTTWLHRIVANEGYDFQRRRSRHETPVLDDAERFAVTPASLVTEPHAAADAALLLETLLKQLSPEQRDALLLVDGQGYSIEEAAQRLGTRPGTVKSRRSRARQILRSAYPDDG